jgi:hypothetical protein
VFGFGSEALDRVLYTLYSCYIKEEMQETYDLNDDLSGLVVRMYTCTVYCTVIIMSTTSGFVLYSTYWDTPQNDGFTLGKR